MGKKNTVIQQMAKTDEIMLLKNHSMSRMLCKNARPHLPKRFGRTVQPPTGSDFHFTNAERDKILMGCYGNVDVLMNEAPIFCEYGHSMGAGGPVLLYCGKQPFCLEPITEAKHSESVFSI